MLFSAWMLKHVAYLICLFYFLNKMHFDSSSNGIESIVIVLFSTNYCSFFAKKKLLYNGGQIDIAFTFSVHPHDVACIISR